MNPATGTRTLRPLAYSIPAIYRERVTALDEGATLRTRGDFHRIVERFGTPRNSH